MAQPKPHLASTAQQYLEIADITNDLLVLRDGSTALVLQVNAINFGLLSEPEQDAIIYAYAALINSLSFPIQIVITSRPKDVSSYLEYIDEQYHQAPSDLRRQQIVQYRQFVSNLITEQNVLDKRFYVVLPLSSLELGVNVSVNPLSTLFPSNKPVEFDRNSVIERSTNTLGPRRDHMISQFSRLGLRARQLQTKELIALFYTLYNGQAAEGTKVVDTKEYTTAVIQPQGVTPFTMNVAPAAAEQVNAGFLAPTAPNLTSPVASLPAAPPPTLSAAPTMPSPSPVLPDTPAPVLPRSGSAILESPLAPTSQLSQASPPAPSSPTAQPLTIPLESVAGLALPTNLSTNLPTDLPTNPSTDLPSNLPTNLPQNFTTPNPTQPR